MKRLIGLYFFVIYFSVGLMAQSVQRNVFFIPDIDGYISLKCDFHSHTVFSDGRVWPDIRIEEAFNEGLDVLAITDHIEYLKHKDDITSSRNRSYEIAIGPSKIADILLVKAAEITRKMPPGHLNALFIQDADSLVQDAYIDAIKEAKRQGAFIIWNHPGWKPQAPEGIKWYDEHTELFENGLINGIEIVNGNEYYPEALIWCTEKNLTVFGNSDIHGSLATFYLEYGVSHRPITIVFAREKTLDAVKEALYAGRTLVWYDDKVAGKKEYVEKMAKASLELLPVHFSTKKVNFRKIKNNSSFDFIIETGGEEYHLYPMSEIIIHNPVESEIIELKIKNFINEEGDITLVY